MFAVKKWIVPVAALALLTGVGQFVRADDTPPTTAPAGKATVTVTVLDTDSKPAEGVRVAITPSMGRKKATATAAGDTPDPSTGTKMTRPKPIATGVTDKDGKAVLMNVPDGTFNVSAMMKGMAGRKRVTIVDGKDAEVSITLKARAPRGEAPAAPAVPAAPAAPSN